MKKALAVLAVFVLLLGTVAPSDAWVHGGFHHGHGGWGWWWPGALIGGLVLGTAIAATAAPYYYYPPPAAVYQPAPVYVTSAPASAPPVQREVVYPNGKYVLYGDGVSQPWQWVWVPSAPPPPAPPR